MQFPYRFQPMCTECWAHDLAWLLPTFAMIAEHWQVLYPIMKSTKYSTVRLHRWIYRIRCLFKCYQLCFQFASEAAIIGHNNVKLSPALSMLQYKSIHGYYIHWIILLTKKTQHLPICPWSWLTAWWWPLLPFLGCLSLEQEYVQCRTYNHWNGGIKY